MRVFLSDDVAADVLISGFEYGMDDYVISFSSSSFCFLHLKENFQFVNEKS
jgi:hypothetical protein